VAVTLVRRTDDSPAAWISGSEVSWPQLVTFGPSGFAAYARLRFLRDPAYPGETEVEAGRAATRDGREQWPALIELLAAHTRTPDDCYFCLWEGWPTTRGESVGSILSGPKVAVPGTSPFARAYFLFQGPLSENGEWGIPIEPSAPYACEPAFIWPADHAWCVANDVDPHWAGIGGQRPLIDALLKDASLDVVDADPEATQPAY
jgi:hypothetical protein